MNIDKRINAFVTLGQRMLHEHAVGSGTNLEQVIEDAKIFNPWFTAENIRNSVNAIATQWLNKKTLTEWMVGYQQTKLNHSKPRNIGVIMAGNIPLVGFHDFLCVLISGHKFIGKFSSKDGNLMQAIIRMLIEIEPDFESCIEITDNQLKSFDAIIATGSDNTSKYFEYYFRNHPSIIRKHRNSIAILTGNETSEDLVKLGNDIFTYFGLGCRNVSKIFVPKNYNFVPFIEQITTWQNLVSHNKYANNYEYNRAILIMNQIQHLDTGFLIISPSDLIESPVGMLYYQEYNSLDEVKNYVNLNSDKIQCIVGAKTIHPNAIPFGTTQQPAIDDYADGIDTIKFLCDCQP